MPDAEVAQSDAMVAPVAALSAASGVEETRKFKVLADGLSATLSLDAKWLARPFSQAVVRTVVAKLNKRADVEAVSAEYLESVEVDGVAVECDASTLACDVVPAGTSQVTLTFGSAPPSQLKFVVHSSRLEFTITLDAKFMRKSFVDAVVRPFVVMANKRSHVTLDAEGCVEAWVDGVKPRGGFRSERLKPAYAFVGRAPRHVELFFSYDAVERASKPARPHSSLRFKVYVPPAGELHQKTTELVLDHQELNWAEAEELADALAKAGTLTALKRLYLQHNDLRDEGAAAIGAVATGQAMPALHRLHLGHNRIGDKGAAALAAGLHPSPKLDQLCLEHNWIGDVGALALATAIEGKTLTVGFLDLHANPAVTPAAGARLRALKRDTFVALEEKDATDRTPLFDQTEPVPMHAGFPSK